MGNLVAGCLSILSDAPLAAAGFILLGAFLDLFDGMVARWMKQDSPLGVQLDSLADMVTFGVAPAILFLRVMPPDGWVTAIALLIPVCSAWRLAVFNLLPPSPVFRGLPTPANALWYAGLSLWLPVPGRAPELLYHPPLHATIALGLCAWMVSRLAVPSLKSPQGIRGLALPALLALFALSLAVGAGYPWLAPGAALAGGFAGMVIGAGWKGRPKQ